ncbi:hypothetical protein IQ06DRAFT_31074 [Phaeosphaeriaceae sp. SRC1lsM3a]|nr:hypothetical protein IQ06DRAFT_31074 [Stagonospora sp. SRC1lsM3a]
MTLMFQPSSCHSSMKVFEFCDVTRLSEFLAVYSAPECPESRTRQSYFLRGQLRHLVDGIDTFNTVIFTISSLLQVVISCLMSRDTCSWPLAGFARYMSGRHSTASTLPSSRQVHATPECDPQSPWAEKRKDYPPEECLLNVKLQVVDCPTFSDVRRPPSD